MKSTNLLLGLSAVLLLSACQTIQPFDGQSGYQREATTKRQEVVVSYVLDAKTNEQTTENKLQKACAKELGLTKGTKAKFKTLYERKFVGVDQSKSQTEKQSIPLGNSQRASFGLSSTPKLSNTDNHMNMLDSKPTVLKKITVQCLK